MASKNGVLSDLQLKHRLKAGEPVAKSDGGGLIDGLGQRLRRLGASMPLRRPPIRAHAGL